MRININEIIPPLERDVILTDNEVKVLRFYLKYGGMFMTLAALSSIFLMPRYINADIPKNSNWFQFPLLAWALFMLAALIKCGPLIFFFSRDFIVSYFKQKKYPDESQAIWERGMVLFAAFFGWNRFNVKQGNKPLPNLTCLEDLFEGDDNECKGKIVDFFKRELNSFNDINNVEVKYKATCYKCLYEAAFRERIISNKFSITSYGAYAQFLKLLGSNYKYSESAIKHANKEELPIFNNSYTYDSFLQVLRVKIGNELNIK